MDNSITCVYAYITVVLNKYPADLSIMGILTIMYISMARYPFDV